METLCHSCVGFIDDLVIGDGKIKDLCRHPLVAPQLSRRVMRANDEREQRSGHSPVGWF